jgi:hypothetical protein
MFTQQVQDKLKAAWRATLANLAQVEVIFTATKPPNQSAKFFVAFRYIGRDDPELLNAYGPGAASIIADSTLFPVKPVKFDKFISKAGTFVIQAVHERIVSNDVSFYEIYAKG